MKTASLTAPLAMTRSQNRCRVAKYLPHIVVATLVIALLLFASRHGYTGPLVNFSLSHLGPH